MRMVIPGSSRRRMPTRLRLAVAEAAQTRLFFDLLVRGGERAERQSQCPGPHSLGQWRDWRPFTSTRPVAAESERPGSTRPGEVTIRNGITLRLSRMVITRRSGLTVNCSMRARTPGRSSTTGRLPRSGPTPPASNLAGIVDDFAVFASALSEADIVALAGGTNPDELEVPVPGGGRSGVICPPPSGRITG
ncbi:MAG: hypothetical protein CM1200mP29_15820 [Verrucomicrobiota bacterium]|nr:MAG: hypothetical protein CM1200mP29_15820 [Verrucomicrobiota bacterium]